MNSKLRRYVSKSYNRYVKRGISGITASSRVLPDFIIVGTVRSGSTSLYYNICEHPSVLSAAYDEIGFFDSNYHLGINWYRSMFPTIKEMENVERKTGFAITGEDTPFYLWKEEAAKRIFEMNGDTKIIGIFRNPVDRAYSNYNLAVRSKIEKLTFEEAIDEEIGFLKKHSFRESVDNKRSYLAKGIYENQIKIWFELFPREQIHLLSTEDMQKNPEETLQKAFRFLEIPDYIIKNPQKQKAAEYKKMNNETREKLVDFYKQHNERFFKTIKKKFDWDF